MGGIKIKVWRPKEFFKFFIENSRKQRRTDKENEEEELKKKEEQEADKIYMGGFPTYLKEEQVRAIAETYGELKFFSLVKDSSDPNNIVSKGYCFFQFRNNKNTDKAIKGLNGLEVGDRKLKVQRASVGQASKITKTRDGDSGNRAEPTNSSGSFLAGCIDLI